MARLWLCLKSAVWLGHTAPSLSRSLCPLSLSLSLSPLTLSVCLSVTQSARLSVCLSVRLSVSFTLFAETRARTETPGREKQERERGRERERGVCVWRRGDVTQRGDTFPTLPESLPPTHTTPSHSKDHCRNVCLDMAILVGRCVLKRDVCVLRG